MDKTAHRLTRVRQRRFPHRLLFFDSESSVSNWDDPFADTKEHTPRLIVSHYWVLDGSRYVQREERIWEGDGLCAAFWDYVGMLASSRYGERQQGSLTVVAHNLKYDVQATGGIHYLTEAGWTGSPAYAKGLTYICRLSRQKRGIALVSSTNWYPMKLERLGRDFGIDKLDTDTQTKDRDELLAYCRRDVEVMERAVLFLFAFLDGRNLDGSPLLAPDGKPLGPVGTYGDTIASVAFKAYRYGFMDFPVDCHVDPEATTLERASYHGGRTEVFYLGKQAPLPVRVLDKNSLYPSVMRGNLYPTRLLGVREGDLTALRLAVEGGSLVIADVSVSIDRPSLPHVSDKLTFPVGEFDTVLTTPELRVAFAQGEVLAVRKWALYEGAPIFDRFISTLYGLREVAKRDGNESLSLLYKNLMNNLYGKFGQRSEEWEEVGPAPPEGTVAAELASGPMMLEDGTIRTFSVWAGRLWQTSGVRKESYNSFPAIASFVTAYARVSILADMTVAGAFDPEVVSTNARAGREVFYMDTDSLHVTEVGYKRLQAAGLVDEFRLGALKLERTGTEDVRYDGAKQYHVDSYRKHKGIPKGAVTMNPDGTPVRTKSGLLGARVVLWPYATNVSAGNFRTFRNVVITKRLEPSDYTKGDPTPSGWVLPLRMTPAPEATETAL